MTALLADTHGTRSRYVSRRCRCVPCVTANNTYQAAYHWRRRRRLNLADAPHGTLNGYTNYGCRCPACRETRRAYDQQRGAR